MTVVISGVIRLRVWLASIGFCPANCYLMICYVIGYELGAKKQKRPRKPILFDFFYHHSVARIMYPASPTAAMIERTPTNCRNDPVLRFGFGFLRFNDHPQTIISMQKMSNGRESKMNAFIFGDLSADGGGVVAGGVALSSSCTGRVLFLVVPSPS